MRWLSRMTAVGLMVAAVMPAPAKAEDCKLQFIPVDLVPNEGGPILLSLKTGDRPAIFMLDTGAGWSVIRRGKFDDLPIHTRSTKANWDVGKSTGQTVFLPSLSIGTLNLSHMEMFVVPENFFGDDRVVGLIGANILKQFDVEINFLENKVNFFIPSNCGDRVVYWKNEGFAVLPFEKSDDDRILVDMKLDGKPIRVAINTATKASELDLNTASWLFDLKPGMPGVEEVTRAGNPAEVERQYYRHRFQKLEMDGIAFNNPWFLMAKGNFRSDRDRPGNGYDLILGVRQLRGLHMYIAYQDKKIYVTAASAKVDRPQDSETSPAAPKDAQTDPE